LAVASANLLGAQHDIFLCRCRRLALIDTGHWLGVLAITGAILGWFGR
jgi:hypothetical protein